MGALFSCMCTGGQLYPDDPRSSTTGLHQTEPSPAGRKDLEIEKGCDVNNIPSSVIGVASRRPRLQPIIPRSDNPHGEHAPPHPSVMSHVAGHAAPLNRLFGVSSPSSCSKGIPRIPSSEHLLFSNDLGWIKVSAVRKLLQYSDSVGNINEDYCIFYLALSLHPIARHIIYQPRNTQSNPQPPQSASYFVQSASYFVQDRHSCLTRDVKDKGCLLHTTKMQTRARNMISLLWTIGSGLEDHDRLTLLQTAFLDGFRAARRLCPNDCDISRGDRVYAALSPVIIDWSEQLLEIPSRELYPYNKGCIPPKIPPRGVLVFDEHVLSDTQLNESKTRKLNVKYDYLDLLNPPIDGFTAVPATKRTHFIVKRIFEDFGIGSISRDQARKSIIWEVPPLSDVDQWAANRFAAARRAPVHVKNL